MFFFFLRSATKGSLAVFFYVTNSNHTTKRCEQRRTIGGALSGLTPVLRTVCITSTALHSYEIICELFCDKTNRAPRTAAVELFSHLLLSVFCSFWNLFFLLRILVPVQYTVVVTYAYTNSLLNSTSSICIVYITWCEEYLFPRGYTVGATTARPSCHLPGGGDFS